MLARTGDNLQLDFSNHLSDEAFHDSIGLKATYWCRSNSLNRSEDSGGHLLCHKFDRMYFATSWAGPLAGRWIHRKHNASGMSSTAQEAGLPIRRLLPRS